MTISYPLSLPSSRGLKGVTFRQRDVIGLTESPFTLVQNVYEHQGDGWGAVMSFSPVERAYAEDWIGWRLALKGSLGTFLMGDPLYITPRGTWAGFSPVVNGSHAAGAKTLYVRNIDGLSVKRGDKFQVGSGSSSRLHVVTQDDLQAGSPSFLGLEIWPRLRDALSDGAAVTLSSPKGLWRIASNANEWTLDPDAGYQLPPLEVVEARA